MTTYGGSGGEAQFQNWMEVSDQLHTPTALLSGEKAPSKNLGRCGEETNLLTLPGIESIFLSLWAHNIVPISETMN
jgi:hypothetical protein